MPDVRTFGAGGARPRVLAVGCGGGGCNALRALPDTPGLDVLAVNDVPHPSLEGLRRRLLLDRVGLRDLASMDPRAVKTLASTPEQAIAVEIADADLVFALAGLGGSMGSWGSSLVCRVAVLKGITTCAVATTPFGAEGPNRRAVAGEALALLRRHAHAVVALSNDPLVRIAPNVPFLKAFEIMARLSVQPVRDLLRVLTREDLPLLKESLRGATEWHLGIGESLHRERPAEDALDRALRSPWIGRPAEEARRAILLVSCPEPDGAAGERALHDLNLHTPRASVLWGAFESPAGEPLRATVLLGF